MSHVKTAISISEPLFKKAEELASKMNTSRSRLFEMAMFEFIQKQENKKLFEKINAAYDDMPDSTERKLQESMKVKHHRLM
jgi:metal-responsive CopG/Arc/MetJ family transcriptional regulator